MKRLDTSFGSAEPQEPQYPLPCLNLITLITYQFSLLLFVCLASPWLALDLRTLADTTCYKGVGLSTYVIKSVENLIWPLLITMSDKDRQRPQISCTNPIATSYKTSRNITEVSHKMRNKKSDLFYRQNKSEKLTLGCKNLNIKQPIIKQQIDTNKYWYFESMSTGTR